MRLLVTCYATLKVIMSVRWSFGLSANREKVVKGWILLDVFAFIGFKKVVVVAVAGALLSFSSLKKDSKGRKCKKAVAEAVLVGAETIGQGQ